MKKKLTLDDLKIQSFTTSEQQKIKGGGGLYTEALSTVEGCGSIFSPSEVCCNSTGGTGNSTFNETCNSAMCATSSSWCPTEGCSPTTAGLNTCNAGEPGC